MKFHIFLLCSIVYGGCNAFYNPLSYFYDAGSATLEAVESTVEDAGSAALDAGGAALGAVESTVEDVGSAALDATLGAAEDAGSALVDVGTTIGNFGTSIYDLTTGVLATLPDLIPTPAALFSLTKNAIAGYPFEVAFAALNLVCSAAQSAGTLESKYTPDIELLNFILFTPEGNYSIPFSNPNLLWAHKAFDKEKNTEILVTGWTTDASESNTGLSRISKAYLCRGGFNFIAIDTAQFVTTLFTWSAFNTEEIGILIGQALAKLVKNYPAKKIHVIGHSLGAHISGACGREFFRLTDTLLPRITGLDPANPCFNEGESLTGLARGDAVFVDIIHSNNGALGKKDAIGDIDFYPNGLDPLPPGCFTITCAHARSYDYYSESVYPGNENGFMAIRCNSITAYNNGECKGKEVPMGFNVTIGVKGNYFLNTNYASPFGLHSRYFDELVCNDKSIVVTEENYVGI